MADIFQIEAVRHDSDERALLDGAVAAADAAAQPRLALQCMVGLNWFQVSSRGVLSSYCFRRVMEHLQRTVVTWWQRRHPRNIVMPEEGSLLAIFRNAAVAPFPWDSDFDLKLYSGVPREDDDLVEGDNSRLTKADFLQEIRSLVACDNAT